MTPTPIDLDELTRLLAELATDRAAVVPFAQRYGDRLASAVRFHLRAIGRADLAVDREEVQGLVWDVALLIQEHAAAWQPGGALPWNWARRGIRKLIADAVGHARADVDLERLDTDDVHADRRWAVRATEVGLEDLGADPVVALLCLALDTIACSERDRQVHVEYRHQLAAGDPSPAQTVAAIFGLSADNVRQIDRRVRVRLQRLAEDDGRFVVLAGLPWVTGLRSTAPVAPDAAATCEAVA